VLVSEDAVESICAAPTVQPLQAAVYMQLVCMSSVIPTCIAQGRQQSRQGDRKPTAVWQLHCQNFTAASFVVHDCSVVIPSVMAACSHHPSLYCCDAVNRESAMYYATVLRGVCKLSARYLRIARVTCQVQSSIAILGNASPGLLQTYSCYTAACSTAYNNQKRSCSSLLLIMLPHTRA
jgi:hypothetical protein